MALSSQLARALLYSAEPFFPCMSSSFTTSLSPFDLSPKYPPAPPATTPAPRNTKGRTGVERFTCLGGGCFDNSPDVRFAEDDSGGGMIVGGDFGASPLGGAFALASAPD